MEANLPERPRARSGRPAAAAAAAAAALLLALGVMVFPGMEENYYRLGGVVVFETGEGNRWCLAAVERVSRQRYCVVPRRPVTLSIRASVVVVSSVSVTVVSLPEGAHTFVADGVTAWSPAVGALMLLDELEGTALRVTTSGARFEDPPSSTSIRLGPGAQGGPDGRRRATLATRLPGGRYRHPVELVGREGEPWRLEQRGERLVLWIGDRPVEMMDGGYNQSPEEDPGDGRSPSKNNQSPEEGPGDGRSPSAEPEGDSFLGK